MSFGPWEILIVAILIFALFGYKKLPDATRAVGRSLRIFKGEMQGMKDDDVTTKAEAQTVRSPIPPVVEAPVSNPVPPVSQPQPQPEPVRPASAEPAAQPPATSAGESSAGTSPSDPTAPPRA